MGYKKRHRRDKRSWFMSYYNEYFYGRRYSHRKSLRLAKKAYRKNIRR